MERWRTIPLVPEYQASSHGRIRKVAASPHLPKSRVVAMRQIGKHKGQPYLMVTLFPGGVRLDICVHVLVCEAFHGRRPGGKQAAHWDGCGLNNRPGNLRWATPKENMDDRFRHGRTAHSEKHYEARFTAAEVRAIRRYHQTARFGRGKVPNGTIAMLAEKYNVTEHAIEGITSRKKWKHV